MVSQPAGALGTVVLTALADTTSVATALIAGGVVLALGPPFNLPAWRREQWRLASHGLDVATAEESAPLV
jgi:hypothetical protein